MRVADHGIAALRAVASLSQLETNGLSLWGTLDAPTLPAYLSDNVANFSPWVSNEALSPSSPDYAPDTGVTRHYDFITTRDTLCPDGYEKSGIFVNNQFPGPAIEANWGDWIEVTVHNNITGPGEGTAIHWHGIRQEGTQFFDGVPSVSQCPIAPGASFVYRFRADTYGTSWWHSHFSAQYTAGVFGPLIIYGPEHVHYDVDVGPVMLGDWYHRDYFSILEDVAGTSQDFNVYVPWSDNSLINGKNNYNCTMAAENATCVHNAGLSKFKFYRGKSHRLRLMNSGAAALVHFSIDGHRMQVIANDFTPIQPYYADYITLGVGQRTDIVVEAPEKPLPAYWIRSTISLNCSVSYTPDGLAVALYDHSEADTLPTTKASSEAAAGDEKMNLCRNDPIDRTVPYYSKPAALYASTTETIEIDLFTNETGHHVWIMNNQTERTDYNAPLLGLASQRNFSFDPEWNVYNFGMNRTVRIVMNNKYQSAHPMHIHGHAFSVLSEGDGYWDGHSVTNPLNPLRRDTHMLRRYGHLVIQFETDNPGVWLYHCHIAWHAAMGYTLSILERPLEIDDKAVSKVVGDSCDAWDRWTLRHTVDQIDSGT